MLFVGIKNNKKGKKIIKRREKQLTIKKQSGKIYKLP